MSLLDRLESRDQPVSSKNPQTPEPSELTGTAQKLTEPQEASELIVEH